MNKITVDEEGDKIRLDKFLKEKFPEMSRSLLQKLIKQKQITVNNDAVPVHHFLKVGEKISIKKIDAPVISLPKTILNKIKIIFENDDYIILFKPSGVLVHPTARKEKNTLVDWLLKKYPDVKDIGDDPNRPGIVHRLDKEVSGLMIVAKSNDFYKYIKKQFKQRKVYKEYIALVFGKIEKPEGLIDFPLAKSKEKLIVAHARGSEGKKAITKFELLETFKNFSLVKINILTGRTHQIRVHFFAYGHPVVGDKLYKLKKYKSKYEIKRPFLEAVKLGFYNKKGKYEEFSLKMSRDLNDILKLLKS